MENNFIYFISDILIAIGAVLSIAAGFKMKEKNSFWGRKWSPKRHVMLLSTVLFLSLLGFIPFIGDFLKLTELSGLFSGLSFTPYFDFSKTILNGSLIISPLAVLFKFLIVSSAFVASLLSLPFVKVLNQRVASFSTLFLFVVLGGLLLSVSNDVLSLFISLEIISVALCFLIANFSGKKEGRLLALSKECEDNGICPGASFGIFNAPLEASVKYFTTNAVASAFMLLAASYIYLHLGTLNFSDIQILAINKLLPQSPLLNAAEVIFFSALVFKIGGYPFYLWVMDVFKGSNYAISLLISSTIQTAGAAALIKSALALGYFGSILNFALILCAVLTLVIGSLLAFRIVKKEGSIKDFLSANTILNAGYIFLGVSFFTKGALCAAIFFLIVYLVMNFGLWAGFGLILKNLKGDAEKDTRVISSLRGLAYISPAFTTAFTICILSFAGFPLMAGFGAKFYLLVEILRCGVWAVHPLLFMAFSSILCVYFCFKIIQFMFQKPDNLKVFKKNAVFNKTNVFTLILMLASALLFILFFISGPVIKMLNAII